MLPHRTSQAELTSRAVTVATCGRLGDCYAFTTLATGRGAALPAALPPHFAADPLVTTVSALRDCAAALGRLATVLKLLAPAACLCVLAGCSSRTDASDVKVDIGKVSAVKSSFGPDFSITEIGERGIDPQLLASRKLPAGLRFDPATCAKLAEGPNMPPDLKGNMAAVSAEGKGNRFVVIAMETSAEVPLADPGKDCTKVEFAGAQLRGGIEVVEAPHIAGVHTLGVHRVLQAVLAGAARTGELYDYSAQFGDYQVIVIANPLVIPGKPVAPVDTARARDLLVKAVAAVRS